MHPSHASILTFIHLSQPSIHLCHLYIFHHHYFSILVSSINPSIHPSTHPSIHPSIHPFVYSSYMCICFYFYHYYCMYNQFYTSMHTFRIFHLPSIHTSYFLQSFIHTSIHPFLNAIILSPIRSYSSHTLLSLGTC